jgi:peroxiredoxin
VELYEKYEADGFKVVSINSGTLPPAAGDFLNENNVRHIVLSDEDREVFDAYKVTGIPVTVVVDHEGRVIYRHLGFSQGDEEKLAKEIETLIAWRGGEA